LHALPPAPHAPMASVEGRKRKSASERRTVCAAIL
jgi:hypothetical protein